MVLPSPSDRSFAAIVLAAGSGTRFGRPKHDIVLAGRPMWQWSVEVFERSGATEIVVVGDVPGGVRGGRRRRDSVKVGLDALTTQPPIVAIHDAARPLIEDKLVASVVGGVGTSGADGVIPAIEVTDTIKRAEGSRITATLVRSELVAVQTPQAFRTDVLSAAHLGFVDDDVTDDATLVERAGGKVVIVDGDRMNLKITFPSDLVIAESILEGRWA